jgi:hypothetical protein
MPNLSFHDCITSALISEPKNIEAILQGEYFHLTLLVPLEIYRLLNKVIWQRLSQEGKQAKLVQIPGISGLRSLEKIPITLRIPNALSHTVLKFPVLLVLISSLAP